MRGAAQRLRLLEIPVRPVRARHAAAAHGAGRRVPLFQCLRPARAAQGADGVGGVPFLPPVSRRRPRQAVRGLRRLRRGRAAPRFRLASTTSSTSISISSIIPERSGIFNLGTGAAATFNDVACATINAVRKADGKPARSLPELVAAGAITYVPFPPALVGKYQSFTQADLTRLRARRLPAPMHGVAEGVSALRRTADFGIRFLRVTWVACGGGSRIDARFRCPRTTHSRRRSSCNDCCWRSGSRCAR